MKKIKREIKLYRDYMLDLYNSRGDIKMFNTQWGCMNTNNDNKQHWLYRFIVERGLISHCRKEDIAIFGNCRKKMFTLNHSPIKIYYTTENNHFPNGLGWDCNDLLLSEPSLSLSIGFDYLDNAKYIRFPYWLMAHFSPLSTYEDIKAWCEKVNKVDTANRKDVAFICKCDYDGKRSVFADLISKEGLVIKYPSKFRHNDDSLIDVYNDDKINYLRNFKFNLCPENSSFKGYCTEKIFDAVTSGCIPIYWGNEGMPPEPDIVNKDAIIYIDSIDTGLLKRLIEDEKEYLNFASQPRLMPDAADVIFNYFLSLENKLREIL